MKHTKILALTCAVLFIACQRETVRIEGNIDNLSDGDIYMSLLDTNFRLVRVDTAKVVDGHFVFDKKVSLPMAECIVLSNGKRVEFPIFAGNDEVTIQGDVDKPDDLEMSGSTYFDVIHHFGKNMPESERFKRLQREYEMTTGNVDRQNVIREEMESIQQEQVAYIKKMIQNNATNPVGPFLLSNTLRYFDFDEVEELVETFVATMPDYKYVRVLRRFVEMSRGEHEANKLVEVGRVAPDFELMNDKGDYIKLSSLRGKVVLLDFWASSVELCRKNNASLRDTYDKFADKNFEIVSVCIDMSKNNWLGAIKEDGLRGTLLIDNDNLVREIYCVRRFPCSFLLDEDGRIVSRDSDPKRIFSNLNSIFGNK